MPPPCVPTLLCPYAPGPLQILVMQQMNHVLAQKALDGFFVATCDCGVNHREAEEGGMHHNLYYHILLKRVVPVTPSLHPPEIHMQVGGVGHWKLWLLCHRLLEPRAAARALSCCLEDKAGGRNGSRGPW